MDRIYIALVDTPGLFAFMIRRVIHQSYVHVVLSMDDRLEEAYSIGRRSPFIPFFAGFEKEEKDKIVRAFPHARYLVYSLPCEEEKKKGIHQQLKVCYEDRFSYHYCILGLPFLLAKKAFYQKNHYTCSSFTARCLEDHGMKLFDKHFSLVTPKDFYELPGKQILFEGELKGFINEMGVSAERGVAYEG